MKSTGLRILLTSPLDRDVEARLEAAVDVVRPASDDEASLREAIQDCDALIARTHTPVTRELLTAGSRLRVVGVAGVGLDRVDQTAADELGIKVLSRPAAASDAVAELTVALMLQLLRPIQQLSGDYRVGKFQQARAQSHGGELREKTVGIIGMGRIGARVARICAAGFGARVLYNDIIEVGPFDFSADAVDRSDIWSTCEIISLHTPLTEQTRWMIDSKTLSKLPPCAMLINTARGAIVDTPALAQALTENTIAGAALDVTDPEPLPGDHPLFSSERCILTPHIAARTHRGLRRMMEIADDVLAFLHTDPSRPV